MNLTELTSYKTPMLQVKKLTAGALFAVLVLGLGLAGCSTAKVQTEHDRAVNFSSYKTFAVLPISTASSRVDPGTTLRLAQPAEQAVREALSAKGFTEAARDKADFAVLVRGESLPRVEVTNWGYTSYPVYGARRRGWGYSGYSTYQGTSVSTTDERRLVVEIFDNASHKQAWVGWIQRSGSGPVEPEKVQKGIGRILEGFPPFSKQ